MWFLIMPATLLLKRLLKEILTENQDDVVLVELFAVNELNG